MKAFIDTNVIVDVIAHRDPFFEDSQAILSITRNIRHFSRSPIQVMTPADYLSGE